MAAEAVPSRRVAILDPMDVAVIGSGTVGTGIAVLLERAGHRIVGISGRRETRERASAYLPSRAFEPTGTAVST